MKELKELYLLYEKSLKEKWIKIKSKIESYDNITEEIIYKIKELTGTLCPFCIDAMKSIRFQQIFDRCNYCKINKKICNNSILIPFTNNIGLFNYLNTYFIYNSTDKRGKCKRKILFLINTLIKMLKWEMNNVIKNCNHNWEFTGYCFCMCCSEFFKAEKMKKGWYTHGNIVSQCTKCGVLFEKEYGFLNKEEIDNFKFDQGIFPDDIIDPIGIYPLEPTMLCGVWFRNDGF